MMTESPRLTPSFWRAETSTTTEKGAARARLALSGKSTGRVTEPGAGSAKAKRAKVRTCFWPGLGMLVHAATLSSQVSTASTSGCRYILGRIRLGSSACVVPIRLWALGGMMMMSAGERSMVAV